MLGITHLRRRATASLVITTMALAGGLFLSTPAFAADDTLQVLTPAADEVLESRTVTVSGLGTPGGLIQVDQQPDLIEVTPEGTWQTLVAYPENYFAAQSVTVTQTVNGEPAGQVERWFKIPDPNVLFVDSPSDGASVDTRTPTITGSAPVDTSITASIGGEVVGTTYPDESGLFRLVLFTGEGEGGPIDVLVEGVYREIFPVQPTALTITLPASLPAPVVTAPVDETVTGTAITVSGTAPAGRSVFIGVNSPDIDSEGFTALAVTDSSGAWSAVIDLPAGNFTGVAFIFKPADEGFGTDNFLPESYTAEFAFSVQAPAVVVPVVATPAPVKVSHVAAPAPQLAATGSESGMFFGGAGALLALGTVLTIAVRRRAKVRA